MSQVQGTTDSRTSKVNDAQSLNATLIAYHKIGKRYVPVGKAGGGKYGDVFFALKKGSLNNSRPLTSQLVALKMPIRQTEDFCAKEVKSLQKLPNGGRRAQFPECLDAEWRVNEHGVRIDQCNWFTMVLIPGFTISDLEQASHLSIPEALISDIALQLGGGLEWLHKQRLKHGDLHPGNIMLNHEERDISGFPSLKIIDLGATHEASDLVLEWERRRYYEIVRDLVKVGRHQHMCVDPRNPGKKHPECYHDDVWIDFMRVLSFPLSIIGDGTCMGWQECRGRFWSKAGAQRDAASPGDMQSVQSQIDAAARAVEMPSEEDCKQALANVEHL